MTKDWSKYEAEQVRSNSENGERLALIFNQDYQKKFNREITCLHCKSQFAEEFHKYIKTMATKKEDAPKYVLKAKYNGLPLGFGKRGRAINGKLTDAQAKHLLKNHKRGEELFAVLPKPEPKPKAKKD